MNPTGVLPHELRLLDELASIPDHPTGAHLSAAVVEGFVSNTLSSEEESEASLHLSSCDECLAAAERAVERRIRDNSWPVPPKDLATQTKELLSVAGAIQTGNDYVMPGGLHVDTHVSLACLCKSESAVDRLVEMVDRVFKQRRFNVLLSHGWPMAHVARRLVWRYRPWVRTLIESEGYERVLLSREIPKGSSVAILTDVTLSGRLVSRLAEKVAASESKLAAVATVVDARQEPSRDTAILALCSMPVITSSSPIERAGVRLEQFDFNPCSYGLTIRKRDPRSPLRLFDEDTRFAQLWTNVFVAGAYEHHHRDGVIHRNGFIDTERLLEHPLTGEPVIASLVDLILDGIKGSPDVLVVPHRRRGRLVSTRLAETVRRRTGSAPSVLSVMVRGGRAHLTDRDRRHLRDKVVIVCDSAASRGATLDVLCDAVAKSGAAKIGAAVVVSRLKETCEEAFRARLGGRFWRLYYFPTPSFLVSQTSMAACPYCALKAEIDRVARLLDLPAIQELADSFKRNSGDPIGNRFVRPRAEPASGREFLSRCERRMAGGVALHALCNAMNDGMAPLELPEVMDRSIPPTKRAAMLESLPPGVLEWSGKSLENDVQRCLAVAGPHQVWLAAANLCAREGRGDWLDYLGVQLRRGRNHRQPRHFWGWLIFDAVSYIRAKPSETTQVRRKLEAVAAKADASSMEGLGQLIEAVRRINRMQASG
jgi:hypothetical protein